MCSRRHSPSWWTTSYTLVLLTLGCVSMRSGAPRPLPTLPAASRVDILEARTDESYGLRVLWNAAARGHDFESQGWAANTPDELDALWAKAGPMAPLPSVDFARYLVFGLTHAGSYCQREILSAVVERSGVLRLRADEEALTCPDVRVRFALVVAVPRRLLGKQVVVVAPGFDRAYEFSIPSPPQLLPPETRMLPADPPNSIATGKLEAVRCPARGHLALVTLRNGEQVWVAHESDGALSVISAVTSLARWPLQGLPNYLQVPVQWRADIGRFHGGWDWRGHSVHGFEALRPRHWIVDRRGSLWLGGSKEPLHGPVRPRRLAPELDGPDRAYEAPRVSSWAALQDGDVALLNLDLVSSPSTGVRLCTAPKESEGSRSFQGCPREAPVVAGSPARPVAPPFALHGPLMVRRSGTSAEVILTRIPTRASFGSLHAAAP